MKTLFVSLVLAAAQAFVLAGCSDNPNQPVSQMQLFFNVPNITGENDLDVNQECPWQGTFYVS
jgi:hypothetical protein